MEPIQENQTAYVLTPADLASITDPEKAFGTMRLLPVWTAIPEEFKRGNLYTKLAESIFYGTALPDGEIEFLPGFELSAGDLNTCVRVHLQSFGPKHEHKIAGVGYMISKVCIMQPTPTDTAN